MDYLVGVALAIGGLIVALALSLLVMALRKEYLWTMLATLQAAGPLGLLYPSPISALATIVSTVRYGDRITTSIRHFVPILLILLAIVYGVSSLYSPNPSEALNAIIAVAFLYCAILFLHGLSVDGRDYIALTLLGAAPVMLVQGISTVAFRLSSALETSYYTSSVSRLLLGGHVAGNYHKEFFNVHDLAKAGGVLFTNGNRASMVMAVFALMYLSLWIRSKSYGSLFMAMLLGVATIATGSKTALVLSALVLPVLVMTPHVVRIRHRPATAVFAWISIAVVAGLLVRIANLAATLIPGLDDASSSRESLFSAAYRYFLENPIVGLGFGGWDEYWSVDAGAYDLRATLPPHNLLIVEWANAGIVAALIVVLIILKIASDHLKSIARARSVRDSYVLAAQFGAFVWIIAHGMYDNTWFYGTGNTIPVMAILAVQAMSLRAREEATVAIADASVSAPKTDFFGVGSMSRRSGGGK